MCEPAKTSAFGEQLGFILTTNPHQSQCRVIKKKTSIQEYQTNRRGTETPTGRQKQVRFALIFKPPLWTHYEPRFIGNVGHYFGCAARVGYCVPSRVHICYLVKLGHEIHDFQIQKQSYRAVSSQPSIKAKVCTNL